VRPEDRDGLCDAVSPRDVRVDAEDRDRGGGHDHGDEWEGRHTAAGRDAGDQVAGADPGPGPDGCTGRTPQEEAPDADPRHPGEGCGHRVELRQEPRTELKRAVVSEKETLGIVEKGAHSAREASDHREGPRATSSADAVPDEVGAQRRGHRRDHHEADVDVTDPRQRSDAQQRRRRKHGDACLIRKDQSKDGPLGVM